MEPPKRTSETSEASVDEEKMEINANPLYRGLSDEVALLKWLSTGATIPIVDTIAEGRQRGGSAKMGWYWGSVFDPKTRRILVMPGSGKRVLAFDPRTGTQTPIGPDLDEDKSLGLNDAGLAEKYTGGVLAKNGCIYAIPRKANRVLKIDPSTDDVTCIGNSFIPNELEKRKDEVHVPSMGSSRLWLDGALGGDGCIYCVPHDSNFIMRIDPEDDSTALIGPDLSPFMEGKRGAKWLGAVADEHGCVYMMAHETDFILKVTPPASSGGEPEVSPLATDLSDFGGSKFVGGVLGTDGNIYCTPDRSKYIAKIDIATQTVSKIGPDLTTLVRKIGWQKGCQGPTGLIYFSPTDGTRVLILDIITGTTPAVSVVGPEFRNNMWYGGLTYSPDTRTIYGIHRGKVLRITPPQPELARRMEVLDGSSLTTAPEGTDAERLELGAGWWFGNACDPKTGNIFLMPGSAKKVMMFSPSKHQLSLIGADLGTKDSKYHSCCFDEETGYIYGVPCAANQFLRIDPVTLEVSQFGDKVGDGGMAVRRWRTSAIVGRHIYALPCRDRRILKFNMDTGRTSFIAMDQYDIEGDGELFAGCAVGGDGCIYAPPLSILRRIFKLDPTTGSCTFIGPRLESTSDDMFGAAVAGGDGNIYCLPARNNRIAKVDVSSQSISYIGERLNSLSGYKFASGVVGIDGRIIACPCESDRVLCIDVEAQTTSLLSETVEHNRFMVTARGRDGQIFGLHRFPKNDLKVLQIAPASVAHLAPLLHSHPGALGKSGLGAESWELRASTLKYLGRVLQEAVDPTSPNSKEVREVRRAVRSMGSVATSPQVLREALDLELYSVVRELTYADTEILKLVKFCEDQPQYYPGAIKSMADRAKFEPATFGHWIKAWIQDSLKKKNVDRLLELLTALENIKYVEAKQKAKDWDRFRGSILKSFFESNETKMSFESEVDAGDIERFLTLAADPSKRVPEIESPLKWTVEGLVLLLGKEFMKASAPALIGRINNFDKDNCDEAVVRSLQGVFSKHPEFTPKEVFKTVPECEGLCMWLVTMLRYSQMRFELEDWQARAGRVYEQIIESLLVVLPDLLPQVLQLRKKEKEQISYHSMFHEIVELTLQKDGCLVLVFLDGFFLVLLLCFVMAIAVTVHAGKEIPAPLVAAAFIANMYGFCREASKFMVFLRLKLASIYISDFWNMTHIISFITTCGVCFALDVQGTSTKTETVRRLTAVAAFCLWLQFLGFIRSFNRELATFILSITQILGDLKAFLALLVCILIMFGSVFFILLGSQHGSSGEEDEVFDNDDTDDTAESLLAAPFSTVEETALTMYRMMLGASDRSWFQTRGSVDMSVLFFFFYSFFVQILLLSMLIAIVSDSYDYAMVRSFNLFYRARCETAAELVAVGAATWKSPPVKALAFCLRAGAAAATGASEGLFGAPRKFAKPPDDQEGADNWQGRALDTERRTRLAVERGREKIEMKLDEHSKEILSKLTGHSGGGGGGSGGGGDGGNLKGELDSLKEDIGALKAAVEALASSRRGRSSSADGDTSSLASSAAPSTSPRSSSKDGRRTPRRESRGSESRLDGAAASSSVTRGDGGRRWSAGRKDTVR